MFVIAGMTVQLSVLRALVAVSAALRKGSENKWVQRAAGVVSSRKFWIRLLLLSASFTCLATYSRFVRANTLELSYATFLKLMEKVRAWRTARACHGHGYVSRTSVTPLQPGAGAHRGVARDRQRLLLPP
jgi:hypothetical protein